MAMNLDSYDALIDSIYDAGTAGGSIAQMFERIRAAIDGSGAGVSLYDAADASITHTLVGSKRSISRLAMGQVIRSNSDPGLGLVAGPRLTAPRRFTDIVPEPHLRSANWFRQQSELTGMGHGILCDLMIAGARVRLFVIRNAGAPNFAEADLDLIARLGRHIERAFAHSLRRFTPFQRLRGLAVILFDEDRLTESFVRDDAFDRQLAARFGLTTAEQRVLRVMAGGVTRAEGHAMLGIGINSLKSHMRRIYAKTGTRRLPDLILLAQRLRG
jgi:DNA-binding CsgD family transcriptional regulator